MSTTKELSPTTMARLPKVETDRHRKAFAIWHDMGDERTYAAVAEKVGVSPYTIQIWAVAFGWRQRYGEIQRAQRDTVIAQYGPEVAGVRKDGIVLASILIGWKREIAEILDKRTRESRDLTLEEEARVALLKKNLTDLGIKTGSGKELRDVEGFFSDLVNFDASLNPDAPKINSGGGEVNINQYNLVIKGKE